MPMKLTDIMDEEFAASLIDKSDTSQSIKLPATQVQPKVWGSKTVPASQFLRAQLNLNNNDAEVSASPSSVHVDPPIDLTKVDTMVDMGIDRDIAIIALTQTSNDLEEAITLHLSTDLSTLVHTYAVVDSKGEEVKEGEMVGNAGVGVSEGHSLDADLAFAMHLQQKEDEKSLARAKMNSKSNVIVAETLPTDRVAQVRGNEPRVWSANDALDPNYSNDMLQDGDEEFYSPTEEEDDEYMPVRGGRFSAGLAMKSDGSIVSKHDSKICGTKNAQSLGDSFGYSGSMSTGGSGGVGDFSANENGSQIQLTNPVANSLRAKMLKGGGKKGAGSGRIERSTQATREGVLDRRTRLLLFKLIAAGALLEVHGALKEGKEASVLHGLAPPIGWEPANRAAAGSHFSRNVVATASTSTKNENNNTDVQEQGGSRHVAIKIFKTTLDEFSNRSDYVVGDARYTHVRVKRHKGSKMLKLWAEKEARNLARACRAGLSSPAPVLLREHVLVMEFVGENGWPALQLKELKMDQSKWGSCYWQVLEFARLLLLRCELIHSDLSEYNILYKEGKCHFIDFGQAVHKSHPRANELLERDISIMEDFFRRKGLANLGVDIAMAYVRGYVGNASTGQDCVRRLVEVRELEGDAAALALLEDLKLAATSDTEGVRDGCTADENEKELQVEVGEGDVDEEQDEEEELSGEERSENVPKKVELTERQRTYAAEAAELAGAWLPLPAHPL